MGSLLSCPSNRVLSGQRLGSRVLDTKVVIGLGFGMED